MSRIHEALKKAELERAALQRVDAPALPLHSQTKSAGDERHSALTDSIESHSQKASVMEAEALRSDDILTMCSQPEWHPEPNSNVFSNAESNPHGAEQFRTLRSRLYQVRGNQPLRTLLVTSAAPAEGKTFVTSNLAHAISRQADRRTLIIDADLRCSRLHSTLGAPSSPGLSDYLRGDADERTVIQHGQTGNLWMIPGGTSVTNPSELLSNGRLKTLIDRVSPIFDWVIIDSPPCLPVADASLMADLCDGVLLVVRAGSTPAELVKKAGAQLRKGKVVGVILNAVEQESGTYGSYYSYGHYGTPVTK